MPVLDMPLEKLREYAGSNPRPTDFDTYWGEALAELDAVDPQTEYVKAPFQSPGAECHDMYFTGVRGARLHAKYLRPSNVASPHPAVVLFHGYTGYAGEWFDKLCYVQAGFSVVALDCRGQGGTSNDGAVYAGKTYGGLLTRGMTDSPRNLYLRHMYLDAAQAVRLTAKLPEVDPARIGVTGGSQGGGLTLAAAALDPSAKLAAPVFPFLCDFKRVWDMDLGGEAYKDLRQWFREYDPLHERETEFFTTMGYVDAQFLAPRIRAEVLMSTALRDDICPPSSQFAAYNRIAAPKSIDVYPDYGHEGLRGCGDRVFQFLMGL